MCDSPVVIRVCTFGGEGRCSGGGGEAAVAALRFLSPETGFEITSCSCLARCDRGVVAQLRNDGTIEEELNDAKACSRWLRRLGVPVDARLRDAFEEQRTGAEFEQAGEMVKALEAYNRAFGLATAAGLGVKWRSRPSSVLKAQPGASSGLPSTTNVRRGLASSARRACTTNAYEAETPQASQAQLAWLSSLMVARSRVFTFLSGQKWPKAQRRALEDAQYAVQIAGVALPSRLRPMPTSVPVVNLAAMDDGIPRAAAWERLAEACEAMQDIEGAITAYEQLLILEPPFAAGQSSATAVKRGVQELVLLSHTRGLDDARLLRRELGSKAAADVQKLRDSELGSTLRDKAVRDKALVSRGVGTVTDKALQDVESLRRLVESDLDQLEDLTQRTYGTDTGPLGLGSPLGRWVLPRAMADLSVLRKIAASDINLLQMQIMKGDPTLTFLRDSLCAAPPPAYRHHQHQPPPPPPHCTPLPPPTEPLCSPTPSRAAWVPLEYPLPQLLCVSTPVRTGAAWACCRIRWAICRPSSGWTARCRPTHRASGCASSSSGARCETPSSSRGCSSRRGTAHCAHLLRSLTALTALTYCAYLAYCAHCAHCAYHIHCAN